MTLPERASQLRLLREAGEALGLELSASQLEHLLQYRDLLAKWNAVYNLSAQRDPHVMLEQHLIDCLAVVVPMARVGGQRSSGQGGGLRILDVGSGGGLPGLVLAIARPDWRIDCLDAVAKKAAFLRQAAAELALPHLQGWHARVETWHDDPQAAGGYDLITSRAFGRLADFVERSTRLLRPGGAWAAMKGAVPHEEIAALPPGIRVFHVEPLSLPGLALRRCLVWMEKKDA